MKKLVAEFVASCLTCQKAKIEHQSPIGKTQFLEVLVWKWDSISMDFVIALPRTLRKHDSIWVIVDRLTKSAHFIPVKTTYTVQKYSEAYVAEIVRLHGVPSSIISDRDPKFTSHFLASFTRSVGHQVEAQFRLSPADGRAV